MKTINNFIIEQLKLCSNNNLKTLLTERLKLDKNQDLPKNFIYDLNREKVYFDLDKRKGFQRMNIALGWVQKHCKIDSNKLNSNKLKDILKRTNEYELNSVCFKLKPEDKDLIDADKIKRDYNKVISKYHETIDDDEYIGEIIPFSDSQSAFNYSQYTYIVITDKGILSNYISSFPVYLTKENIF